MIDGWNQTKCKAYHATAYEIDEWTESRKRNQWSWEEKNWSHDSLSLEATSWCCLRIWERNHGHHDSMKSDLRRKTEPVGINPHWMRSI